MTATTPTAKTHVAIDVALVIVLAVCLALTVALLIQPALIATWPVITTIAVCWVVAGIGYLVERPKR